MTNLAGMSPEEKDRMLENFLREKEGTSAPAAAEEPAGDGMDGFIEKVCEVLEHVCAEVETVRAEVADLRKLVVDDFFGNLKKMYTQNYRAKGIGDMRSKYGELFSPFEKVLKTSDPDTDVYEKIFDRLEELKGGEGFTEEGFDANVKEWASLVAKKIDELKAEGKIPQDAEVTVDIETDETAPTDEEKSPARNFVDGIKKRNGGKTPLDF